MANEKQAKKGNKEEELKDNVTLTEMKTEKTESAENEQEAPQPQEESTFDEKLTEAEIEVIKNLSNDETLKEIDKEVNSLESALNNIEKELLESPEAAEKAIKEEIIKIEETEAKIESELKECNGNHDEANKKLKTMFKTKSFSQFWNGISSGWEN